MRVIGLDIGGTKCAVTMAELGEELVIRDKIRFDTMSRKGPAYAQAALLSAVEELTKRTATELATVDAFGVSCGGPLDAEKGLILCPPNLPGWIDVPIVRMLEERFGRPAFLQNDAKASALAEWKYGAGIGARDMLFLTMGTGFGGGIISGGRLLTGARGMAGEVGHIRLAEDGPVGFGKAGSIEGFCSGGGIARLAQDRLTRMTERGEAPAWASDPAAIAAVDVKLLSAKADSGDEFALGIFEATGDKLGSALSVFIDLLNPELIVIGSVFVRCEGLLRPAMERRIERECIDISAASCRVLPAKLGESLGDYAAAIVGAYGLGERR